MQNELELQIQTNAKDTDVVLQKLISTLQKVDTTMNSVLSRMNGKNSTKNLENNIDNLTKKANKFSNAFDFTTAFNVAEKGFRGLFSLFEKSIDYSENANLFNVALDDLTEKGMQFQNTLNEAFGTNQSETLRFQGLFQAMAKSMGVANDYAYALSEGLTKIGFDLASLYNISDVSAMNKLRAGLAGQTEPLRTVGMDITENSLKPIIERLNMRDSEGELLTPRQLNYAEKMLLRYIAIVDQAKVAQGDFANTIESPANQLKILGMQAQEAGRAIGNLFVGALAKILPYANAVIMVIEEVAKAIAGVLGIEIGDYNSSVASVEDAWVSVDDTTSNIGSNLDDANKKAKKLQRTVMGFDEIHSISTPTESKSSSGSGSGGLGSSINPALLEALGTYENGMEKVRMKANEIRDAIMEWLGFTKKINPITGETYWEYQGIDKTLENMWKSFQGLSTTGKIIVGLGLVAGATKLWNVGKKLVSIFGNTGLGKVIKATFNSQKSLFGSMITGIKSSHSSLKTGIQSWREQQGIIDSTTGKVNGFKGVMNGVKNVLMGIGTSAVGLVTLSASIKNATTEGWNLANVLGTVGGTLGSIAGGAMAGAVFGPWGAAIGGVVGAVGSLIVALESYNSMGTKVQQEATKKVDALNKVVKAYNDEKKAIQEELDANLTQVSYSENLVARLDEVVDANGRVKKGYEDRALSILSDLKEAYGVEYTLIDGQIQNYEEYRQSINKAIEAKKAEILLNAKEKAYANALEKNNDLINKRVEAQQAVNKEQKEYDKKFAGFQERWGAWEEKIKDGTASKAMIDSYNQEANALEKSKNKLDEKIKKLDEAKIAEQECSDTIVLYENLNAAVIEGNSEKIKKATDAILNSYNTNKEGVKQSLSEQILATNEAGENILNSYKKYDIEITDEMRKTAYSKLEIVAKDLADQTAKVKELTPEQKEAWKTLAQENYDVYSATLSQMSPEMRTQIQKITNVIIEKTPEVETATNDLSNKVLKKLDKGDAFKTIAVDSVKEYLQGLSDEEQRKLLEDCGVKNVDKVMKGLKKGNLSDNVGVEIIKGLQKGLKNDYWQGQTLSTAFSFATSIIKNMKNALGIKSPSKKAKELAMFTIKGFDLGLINQEKSTLKNVDNFSQKILSSLKMPFENIQSEIKFDDYKVDFSKDINYGKITRDINSKTKVETDNALINSIANAVVQGINAQNVNVQVDINAHTDESTIVNTAIKGINRETTRTGQCPIKVM